MRQQGRATVNRQDPRALAICDRCGFRYNHNKLQWQYQWAGSKLQNLRILVCETCLDVPQMQLKTIIIPADPVPIMNPRPEVFNSSNNNVAVLGQNAKGDDGSPGQPYGFASFSTFSNANAAFDGNANKSYRFSARVPISANSTGNVLGARFSADPSGLSSQLVQGQVSNQSLPQIYQTVTGFKITAPNNTAFLGSSIATSYSLYGYADTYSSGVTTSTQTLVYSGTTAGTVGESITISNLSATYPAFKMFFTGNGINALGVAQFELYAQGPGTVTLGSSAF